MQRKNDSVVKILDQVITDYEKDPVDLLGIGDGNREYKYLVNARHSYLRTVEDVTDLFFERQSGDGEPIKVLEIGAFLGVVSLTLARFDVQVTALDIPEFVSNERLQERYRQSGVESVAANLKDYSLPFASGTFDMVIMCETLEHLNFNPLPVMAEINRILRVDGYLYLALPNLASLPNRFNLLCGRSIHNPLEDFVAQLSNQNNMIVGLHWREYVRDELLEMVTLSGFKCVRHTYELPVVASFLALFLYRLFPTLRPAQNLLAQKHGDHNMIFHFTEATMV
jgi:SAM-dependent methyltransferase